MPNRYIEHHVRHWPAWAARDNLTAASPLTWQSSVEVTQHCILIAPGFTYPGGMDSRVKLAYSEDRNRTSCTHERTCVEAADVLTNSASQTVDSMPSKTQICRLPLQHCLIVSVSSRSSSASFKRVALWTFCYGAAWSRIDDDATYTLHSTSIDKLTFQRDSYKLFSRLGSIYNDKGRKNCLS